MQVSDDVVYTLYPFNPQAIDCSFSTDNPEASLTRASDNQTGMEMRKKMRMWSQNFLSSKRNVFGQGMKKDMT